jgi:hypothetical protein
MDDYAAQLSEIAQQLAALAAVAKRLADRPLSHEEAPPLDEAAQEHVLTDEPKLDVH